MSEQKTPWCDAIESLVNSRDYQPWRNLARQLETELSALKHDMERLHKADSEHLTELAAMRAALVEADKLRIAIGHTGRICEWMHHDPRKHLHKSDELCPVEVLVKDAVAGYDKARALLKQG